MDIVELTDDHALVKLTEPDLLALVGALNEVCNGVEIGDFEFQTRVGMSRRFVRELLDQISNLHRRMPDPGPNAPID